MGDHLWSSSHLEPPARRLRGIASLYGLGVSRAERCSLGLFGVLWHGRLDMSAAWISNRISHILQKSGIVDIDIICLNMLESFWIFWIKFPRMVLDVLETSETQKTREIYNRLSFELSRLQFDPPKPAIVCSCSCFLSLRYWLRYLWDIYWLRYLWDIWDAFFYTAICRSTSCCSWKRTHSFHLFIIVHHVSSFFIMHHHFLGSSCIINVHHYLISLHHVSMFLHFFFVRSTTFSTPDCSLRYFLTWQWINGRPLVLLR